MRMRTIPTETAIAYMTKGSVVVELMMSMMIESIYGGKFILINWKMLNLSMTIPRYLFVVDRIVFFGVTGYERMMPRASLKQ